jgi:Protein of unknown function (DUF3987)
VPALESKSELRIGFFERLFEAQVGYLCIATIHPQHPKASFRQKFFQWPQDHKRVENFILSVEPNHNVYFCVNLLDKQERKKENCLPSKILWADLDDAPLEKVEILPPPILILSSPGKRQGIWRLSSELPADQAEDYSRRIAYFIGADSSGWDLTQLLRVPFTRNFKYDGQPEIILERALNETAPPSIFENLPQPGGGSASELVEELPEELPPLMAITYKYDSQLKRTAFHSLHARILPDDADWSAHLWRLILLCFEVGMDKEEAYVVAASCASNKYIRDNRPLEHLWRDVLKAENQQRLFHVGKEIKWKPLTMPELVKEPATGTIIDSYRDYATETTDAIPEFHDLSCMMIASAILSGPVRLEITHRPDGIVPNLWGLVIGDSTLARKSTAMRMATDILWSIDPDVLVATDGSVEGLLTSLSTRPNKPSMFFRDEVSGFFEAINKKDYLADMPTVLARLYDVPNQEKRVLRKETIIINKPAFIFFGGGVRDSVYGLIKEQYIISGFLPRFLVVSGEADEDSLRDEGPPAEASTEKKNKIYNFFMDLREQYATEVPTKIGGQTVIMPPAITAKLTESAWETFRPIRHILRKRANETTLKSLALPTFERLGDSMLKMSMILAATRQEPVNNSIEITKDDVQNAIWYGQSWGRYACELVQNASKGSKEKGLDKALSLVRTEPGITRAKIMQACSLHKAEADQLFATLEERGLVRKERAGRGWRYWLA